MISAALAAAPRLPVRSADPVRDPLPVVRLAVRELLQATPAYQELSPEDRRRMAGAMVAVCHTAARLIGEEVESEGAIGAAVAESLGAEAGGNASGVETRVKASRPAAPLARAQAGGFGEAATQVAGTTRAVLKAVSFPRFVTELINGVFKAIIDSNQTQLQQYIELLSNVSASTEGFADANMGPARARAWLVERFPEAFEMEPDDPDEDPADRDPEERRERPVRMIPGARMPSEDALRLAFGLPPKETIPSGDPDRVLVPFARRVLSRQRQEMLATLVRMGMQRIVVDAGRITAGMRFHIDTRSATESDTASRFDVNSKISASGSFGAGPWGASASIQNTIGYVSTQSARSTEELNTDLELTSTVELVFRSDYVPLNQLASPQQAMAVIANSRNPEFEAAREAEADRRKASSTADAARRSAQTIPAPVVSSPTPTPAPAAPAPKPPTAAPEAKKPATTPPAPDAQKPATTTPAPNAPKPTTPTAPTAQKPTTTPPTPTPSPPPVQEPTTKPPGSFTQTPAPAPSNG